MRCVNLLQVSSALGGAMEAMHRDRMCRLVLPHSAKAQRLLDAAIDATAEGYSFLTNLDRDLPTNGLVSETQADFFCRATREGWTPKPSASASTAQPRAATLAPRIRPPMSLRPPSCAKGFRS